MKHTLMRMGAVLLGLAAAFVIIVLIEGANTLLFPLPAGLDIYNDADMVAYVASLPIVALVIVIVAHAIASFVGAWVTARLLRKQGKVMVPGLVVGALLMAAGISNLFMIAHPAWFAIADIAVYVPLALMGARLGGMPKS